MIRTLHIQAVLFLCTAFSVAAMGKSDCDTLVHLWNGTAVRCNSVTLEAYLPKSDSLGVGVIVCPGGSYCWHDMKTEGVEVAKWLQNNGIAAFVLKYRVEGKYQFATFSRLIFPGHQHPDMITDMQRAIQYVRENSDLYGVELLGAMGFSAGGHLVMSAAEFFSTDFLAMAGINTNVSLRPDFVAPIYPVVTMNPPYAHRRSRRALLGEYRVNDSRLRDSLSLELHVPSDCPPVFLVNCMDDKVVDYHNGVLLDSALTARGVPHEYIQYRTGGHGFGASDVKGTQECRTWRSFFLRFLDSVLNLR